jgi:hypothetical protein
MATNTYVALDKVTVATATPSVTFTSIPQTYTDLVLVMSGTASGTSDIYVYFNGDTASNYSRTYLYGDGSVAGSGRQSFSSFLWAYAVGSNQNNGILNIQNYSNATTYKTAISRWNIPSNYTGANVGLWRSTTAISSMTVGITGGLNLSSGSTFSLYGIASAEASAKATGGMITSDDTYWYHTFLTSGTFTPNQTLSCDYLVVAGGGAGGGYQGYSGGGGAGGLRSTVTATGGGGSLESALSVTAQAYTITVGAGGASGSSGSNSVFSTITSTGGGMAGYYNGSVYVNGLTGGSGGGGGDSSNGGAGTQYQGYAGGNGNSGPSGGGGGAGAVGGTPSGTGTVAGGIGIQTSISGTTTYYAGGGGGSSQQNGLAGGAGGAGGGGAGALGNNYNIGGAGTVNTGGGGGGSSALSNGGAGGSGIVIVRYAK